MKVAIVGANGQIGQLLVKKMRQKGKFKPTAIIRKPEQKKFFDQLDVPVILLDLESTVSELVTLIKGFDAIVFTAGSGASTGPDKTLLVDLDGAVKIMEVAEKNDIKRFVMVSAIGAHKRERWSEAIKPYFVAKHYADRVLKGSSLDYTIVRPGALTNHEPTGKISVGEDVPRGPISRSDVADVIIAVLENTNTIQKSFDVIEGDILIDEAVSRL